MTFFFEAETGVGGSFLVTNKERRAAIAAPPPTTEF